MGERLKQLAAVAVFLGAWLAFWMFVAPSFQKVEWKKYGYYAPPTLNVVTVKVVLQPFEKTRATCDGGAGCLKGKMDKDGKWIGVPTIYAPTPEGFNDVFAMTILGHEMMHALGAFHD